MPESLRVFHGRDLVGELTPDRSGRIAFAYAESWRSRPGAWPISASLPLDAAPPHPDAGHTFFANLLPEGPLRVAVARRLGLSVSNDLALLRALGGECAGALTVLPGGREPGDGGDYDRLGEREIAALARDASLLAELSAARRPRLSLAGAQDKLPVRIDDDGSVWLPLEGAASTHILKVPNPSYRHLPANEVLVTSLARALDLSTVAAGLRRFEDVGVAVIPRYDRWREGDAVHRLHQEDLCQALGLPPSVKYQDEGGPGFVDVVELVRRVSADPLGDTRRLLRWLGFCLLAGNADGHAKNLSLLRHHEAWRLAPHYDLVCTRAFPRIERRLAMAVGSERDPGLVRRQHWEELAEHLGIGARFLTRLVRDMAERAPAAFQEVAAAHRARHGDTPAIQRIQQVLRRQCRRTLSLLA